MKFNIDVNEITELLKTSTMKQAAVHLSIPYSSVHSFCKKRGLKSAVASKRGRQNTTEQHIDEVVKLYLDGMSQPQIAKKLGISQPTVASLVKKASHHLRTRSESAKLRDSQLDEEQRKKRAAAANAVRHAMGILNLFSF